MGWPLLPRAEGDIVKCAGLGLMEKNTLSGGMEEVRRASRSIAVIPGVCEMEGQVGEGTARRIVHQVLWYTE